MATWGSDPTTVDPNEFPRMKRPGQKYRFRVLAIDCGDDIRMHYVKDPTSRTGRGMPVPCLACCGGTVQQCASTPTPSGVMLHACQEGRSPARRRRMVVWNYDVINEVTKTRGRPQVLEVGGLSQGEGHAIYELIQDPERGDPRFYDLVRVCQEVTNNPLYKTRPVIKDIRDQKVEDPYVHTQVLRGTAEDEDVVETKESARKFFIEFLKRRNAETKFITDKKQAAALLEQWETCWDIVHTPPNTVEGVLAMLKDSMGQMPTIGTQRAAAAAESAAADIFSTPPPSEPAAAPAAAPAVEQAGEVIQPDELIDSVFGGDQPAANEEQGGTADSDDVFAAL